MIRLGNVPAIAGSGVALGQKLILGQNVQGKVREVHPVGLYRTASATFTSEASTRIFPYSIVSGGTRRLSATVVSSLLQSRLDSVPATNYRLMQHRFSGSVLTIEATIDKITALDIPSSIVVSANLDMTRRVEVLFGNNGSSIVSTVNGAVVYQKTLPHVILNADKIKVVRISSVVEVYVNGVFAHAGQHASMKPVLPSQCFAGVALFSTGNIQSTGFKDFTVDGSTDYSSDTLGRLDAELNLIPSSNWWGMGYIYIDVGGPVTVTLRDFAWLNSNTGLNRQFRILVAGNASTNILNANGGTVSENGTLTDGVRIELQAYTNAATGDPTSRTVKSGVLEVVKR